MSEIAEQLHRIEDLRTARYITGTLRDISSIEIKNIRADFERNSQFSAELRKLYRLVWRFGERSGVVNQKSGRTSTLHVAYTTNKHFYGSLNYDIIQMYTKNTDAKDKCLIIGDTGRQLWQSRSKKRKDLSFLSFAGDTPTLTETQSFLERTTRYDHVFVYYPGFISVFQQKPEILDVTFRPSEHGQSKPDESEEDLEVLDAQYLLEPDITEMLTFFNTQVRYILFESMLLESRLSRVAARLVKMDAADQNAENLVYGARRELARARTSFASRRMMETIVGFLQWQTHNHQ